MFLHYNNGEKEKLIKSILSIQIIDGNTPAIIALKSGGELRIRLDRIEMIVDDSIPNAATPVDFVEVVRCKDCRFYSKAGHCGVIGFCEPNEFCSRGEKSEK